jgi:hypothetical protein
VKPALFHPLADEEFAEAITHYAGQAEGLGEKFYAEMLRLTGEIAAAPGLHRVWRHGARRHFGRKFPYALFYVERPDFVLIAAVAHFKRRPGYWRERLG